VFNISVIFAAIVSIVFGR